MDALARQLALVFFVLACGYVVLAAVLGTPFFLATVTSDSMQPALARGDWVVLKKEAAYPVGDVVVFYRGDGPYVHRVSFVAADGSFRTKGDALMQADGWVLQSDDVVGKVVARIPWLGHLSLWLAGR